MLKRAPVLVALVALFAPLAAQTRVDPGINAKIRQEENSRSQIMRTLHYERVVEGDAKASAIAIAATLYQLAMRDEMLPRLAAADMPPPPRPSGQ